MADIQVNLTDKKRAELPQNHDISEVSFQAIGTSLKIAKENITPMLKICGKCPGNSSICHNIVAGNFLRA